MSIRSGCKEGPPSGWLDSQIIRGTFVLETYEFGFSPLHSRLLLWRWDSDCTFERWHADEKLDMQKKITFYPYFAVPLQWKADLTKEKSQIERGNSNCNSSLCGLWYKSVFASQVVVLLSFFKKSVNFSQVIAFWEKGLSRTSSFKESISRYNWQEPPPRIIDNPGNLLVGLLKVSLLLLTSNKC